jgi:DNA repair exonuclease SbcCD nuclease subunit
MGGDTFHVRGHLSPEVLNPAFDTFKRICASGMSVYAIAGNHDLTSELSTELGNAMQSLATIDGFHAITKPTVNGDVILIPWVKDLDHLRAMLTKLSAGKNAANMDVVIHAPVNGVIKGIPDHGLEASELQALGFRRVWSGHYHNAIDFGSGVYSIGATSNQTWSDPGTLAGFWTVEDGKEPQHYETAAPKFVDYDERKPGSEYAGNFVRIKLKEASQAEIDAAREDARLAGALGVVDHSSRKRDVTRGASTAAAGASLEASVGTYIADTMQTPLDRGRITIEALAILSDARSKGAE